MTRPDNPQHVLDDDLGTVQGAGRVPAHTAEWTDHTPSDPGLLAHELTHTVQQDGSRGVWKAPAGTEASVTHDVQFEQWAKGR